MLTKRLIRPLNKESKAVNEARRGNRSLGRGTWRILLKIRRIPGLSQMRNPGSKMLNHSPSTSKSRSMMSSRRSNNRWNLHAGTKLNLIRSRPDSKIRG